MREVESCNPQSCPRDCMVKDWKNWSTCSRTCGGGKQTRSRDVSVTALNGGKACPNTKQSRTCKSQACPVHCTVGKWGAFSTCSTTCGTGSKKRTRAILKLPKAGGFECGALVNVEKCKTNACPVDCKVSKWSAWSPYAGSKASLRRTRIITQRPAHGGKKCPSTVQTTHHKNVAACKAAKAYGSWSKCTKTCGPGYMYRLWEATKCSETSTLKHHLSMRQGRHCNMGACSPSSKDDHTSKNFYVPPITGKQRADAGLPKPE
jgi:hypothetical protein